MDVVVVWCVDISGGRKIQQPSIKSISATIEGTAGTPTRRFRNHDEFIMIDRVSQTTLLYSHHHLTIKNDNNDNNQTVIIKYAKSISATK
jgi:hypothetical protein